jgi:hypothetical protein
MSPVKCGANIAKGFLHEEAHFHQATKTGHLFTHPSGDQHFQQLPCAFLFMHTATYAYYMVYVHEHVGFVS